MELTTRFLKEKFLQFNKEYFNNELNVPNFALSCCKNSLGDCSRKVNRFYGTISYTIRLSNKYVMGEKRYCNVLLHEMIHLYIFQKNLRDNNDHGIIFQSMMKKINSFGWDIEITSNGFDNIDINRSKKKNTSLKLIGVARVNKKYYVFRVASNRYTIFNNALKNDRNIELYSLKYTNSAVYDTLKTCMKKVQGYEITDKNRDLFFKDFSTFELY